MENTISVLIGVILGFALTICLDYYKTIENTKTSYSLSSMKWRQI